MQSLKAGLMLSTLILYGCSSTPQPVKVITKTDYITVYPPSELVQPCAISPYLGQSNGDLLEYAVSSIAYLLQCNADNLDTYRSFIDDSRTKAAPIQ
jgi:hypothetical protein